MYKVLLTPFYQVLKQRLNPSVVNGGVIHLADLFTHKHDLPPLLLPVLLFLS